MRPGLPDSYYASVVERLEQGATITSIALEDGRTYGTVYHGLRAYSSRTGRKARRRCPGCGTQTRNGGRCYKCKTRYYNGRRRERMREDNK